MQQFNHSIIVDMDSVGVTHHTVSAYEAADGTYVVVNKNPFTGAVHERYFETLHEFVLWHYEQEGVELPRKDLPWEQGVWQEEMY